MIFDIEVVCDKCGQDLTSTGIQKAHDRFGHELRIQPCSPCLQAAREAWNAGFEPMADAGPLRHRAYLRPAPDEVAAQADKYRDKAIKLVSEVEDAQGDPKDWQGPHRVSAQLALVYATLALEASTFLSRFKVGGMIDRKGD
jgi:hypothetical protein